MEGPESRQNCFSAPSALPSLACEAAQIKFSEWKEYLSQLRYPGKGNVAGRPSCLVLECQPVRMSHWGLELGILPSCSGSHQDSSLSPMKAESLTGSQVSPAVRKKLLRQGTRPHLTSNGSHFEASPLGISVVALRFTGGGALLTPLLLSFLCFPFLLCFLDHTMAGYTKPTNSKLYVAWSGCLSPKYHVADYSKQ